MLHRYHNIEYILQLDLETGLELIDKAKEKEREARIFQQWAAQLPAMAIMGHSVSYSDYKDRVTGANIDQRPTAEILKELDDIEKELMEGGSGNGS